MHRHSAAAATVAYTLLTVTLTWPLARGITKDVPADFGDPLLNAWVLAWDAEHMLRAVGGNPGALREYWNANIFHPHPLALAYSEHLTPQAAMILPVWALTKNPILCYNLVFLSTFLLSALGMFLFARSLTASPGAAFVAGLAFGFAPYRFGTMSHVQVLSAMWMPFTLLGVHRFFETRRLAPLAGAAGAWLAQSLSCGYYLLFFSPVLALYVGWEILRRRVWTDAGMWIQLVVAGALTTLATVPFLLPYVWLRQLGFTPRSLAETTRFSADVYGYATADIGLRLWGDLVRAWPKPEGSLFPGLTIGFLATLALLHGWRSARRASAFLPRNTKSVQGRRVAGFLELILILVGAMLTGLLLGWTFQFTVFGVDLKVTSIGRVLTLGMLLFVVQLVISDRARATALGWFGSPVGCFAAVSVFAFVMSLGPRITSHSRTISDWNVYSAFYDFVPGFDGLRVPARFAMIVALGLATLAGFGAALFERRRQGVTWLALSALFIVAESWAVPIPVNVNSTDYKQAGLALLPATLTRESGDDSTVYHFLAGLPPSSAVIELPFGEVAFEARYMFYSTVHWRRLVNGYSGGAPAQYGLWADRLEDVLDRPHPAWQAVVESGATHIVVHEGGYAQGLGRQISEWVRAHGGRELAVFGSDRVFSVD
jgi:hypothetical protein